MLDFRTPLILAAAPAGLILGVLGWLALGGPSAASRAIEAVSPAAAARSSQSPGPSPSGALAQLKARPLMGPGSAGPAPAVRLTGLVRRPGRVAALLSFNDEPPVWLELGATMSGMTLVDVGATTVVLESVHGRAELKIGDAATSATQQSAPSSNDAGGPPPGVRLPLEPNDAPPP